MVSCRTVASLTVIRSFCVFILASCTQLPFSRRIVARVAYDGTHFRGFQAQASEVRSVQGIINDAIIRKVGTKLSTTGASRTDHGVHARGNCIHFDIPETHWPLPMQLSDLEFKLNQYLPSDVRTYNVSLAPMGSARENSLDKEFHATASTVGKLYSYRLCGNSFVDPMRRRYTAHQYRKFDVDLFKDSLQRFVGTHNYVSFANKVERTRTDYAMHDMFLNTTRTVDSINFIDEGDGYYRIDIRVQSALYRMIRNIVGTSLHVAEGKMSPAELVRLLKEAPGRQANKAESASPEGLVLEHVYYDNY